MASARGGVDPDGGQNDAGGDHESERSVHSRIQVDHVAAGHRADELHLEKATPSKLAQQVHDRAVERDVACHGDRNPSFRLGSARRGVRLVDRTDDGSVPGDAAGRDEVPAMNSRSNQPSLGSSSAASRSSEKLVTRCAAPCSSEPLSPRVRVRTGSTTIGNRTWREGSRRRYP